MMSSKRPIARKYRLAQTAAGDVIMLSELANKMLMRASKRAETSYHDLAKATRIPVNTLHVYAQRLEQAGLIKREKRMVNSRVHTVITAVPGVLINIPVRRV